MDVEKEYLKHEFGDIWSKLIDIVKRQNRIWDEINRINIRLDKLENLDEEIRLLKECLGLRNLSEEEASKRVDKFKKLFNNLDKFALQISLSAGGKQLKVLNLLQEGKLKNKEIAEEVGLTAVRISQIKKKFERLGVL